jgi:phenylpyruvate tautomerase PptA (4-oxalocrotonate tautomerase family)
LAQVKIYGLRESLAPVRRQLSDTIHACVVETLGLPPEKRFHRFLPLEPEDFVYPAERSKSYTILEIVMFAGRSVETKKALIRLLFVRLGALGIGPADLEITILEAPRHDWGIRGLPGDELGLAYRVEV